MASQQYTTVDNDMIDAVVYKHYGLVDGVLEVVMAANPHLRETKERMSAGVVVELPDYEAPTTRMKRIWDF